MPNQLQFCIICRHGAEQQVPWSEQMALSDDAYRALRQVAAKMLQSTRRKIVQVISSDVLCAQQSAAVIRDVLGLSPFDSVDRWLATSNLLRSDERSTEEDFERGYTFLLKKARGVQVLVIVTHAEMAEYLQKKFSEEQLGTRLPAEPLQFGQAAVIDCAAKTIKVLG